MSARILLVEDEPGVSLVVGDLLRSHGHDVCMAADGHTGKKQIIEGTFDLLILDAMLPGPSGYELCHTAREHGFDGGILMLTARGGVQDRVQGLDEGADDYLVKPFDPEELIARLGALLRRVRKATLTPVLHFEFGNVIADFAGGKFFKNNLPLALAAKEVELLRLLINQRGQALSRDNILQRVWPDQPFITTRTVDVHIAWLRQKIENDPSSPRHIVTVRGKGYQFQK